MLAAPSALTAPKIALCVAAARARLGALTGTIDRGSRMFYTKWLHDTLAWAARKEAY
ncbi:hypothetical protein GCM10027346_42880 [Hymenobacter seoulensis]